MLSRQIDLIKQLTISSFKLRNEGSYLGVMWYFLNPLLTFLILYFIFVNRLGSGIEYYPFYLLIGIIQWNFITLAVGTSMKDVISNSQLIKSMNFKRENLIIASVLMTLINHLLEFLIFFIFLLFFVKVSFLMLLFPLVLFLQFLFILGMCFAFSAIILYFRDLDNIWSFFSRLWWFATPIFYAISSKTPLIYTLNLFNPMYYILTISRDILIYNRLPSTTYFLALACFSLLSFNLGYLIFMRLKSKFAEMI
jgi:ABC-type polysaccharide/polyol phosphate export permease